MAQLNAGDWPIAAATTSGNDLSDKLNRLASAVLSSFSGTGRPPNATAGMTWVRSNANGSKDLMMFNGNTDALLLTVTAGNVPNFPSTYTQAEVDAMIADLDARIGAIQVIPPGVIVLWSGSIAAIPSGWALCNGTNGTPNLRDRFVVGAGSGYGVGAIGGRTHITEVPAHNHSYSGYTSYDGNHNHGGLTGWAGAHSHGVKWYPRNIDGDDNEEDGSINPGSGYTNGLISSVGNHQHTIANSGSHRHSYSGTTSTTGVSSVDVRPPYYALAYIMKL